MDLGLFLKDVAKFIGVSTDKITYWENGKTKPNKKNMAKLKEFLKLKNKAENLTISSKQLF